MILKISHYEKRNRYVFKMGMFLKWVCFKNGYVFKMGMFYHFKSMIFNLHLKEKATK